MGPERDFGVFVIIEVEWRLGIFLTNVVVDSDRNVGVPAPGSEQLENVPLVIVKLGETMVKDKFDGTGPSIIHSAPVRFRLNRLPCICLILFEKR